jgi:dUTP pyrophosphatase
MLKNQIATFSKVSLEQYCKDRIATLPTTIYGYSVTEIEKEYEKIKLPSRATSGSVGYDFYLPYDICLNAGEFIVIPTGIRCEMEEGFSLDIYPKSGLGFKNFTTIANTVGIIDSDYYYSDNEGHIFCKITCDAKEEKEVLLKKGSAFVQGIFLEYGITVDDDVTETRNGGFGSTSK